MAKNVLNFKYNGVFITLWGIVSMGGYMRVHKSITEERIESVVRDCMFGLDNIGICLSCGEEQEGCEPDAQEYECYSCGENQVYGVEEIMLCGYYH